MTSLCISGRSFHFLGIGGAGMSVIAELLLAQGARVSGSDMRSSDITESLARLGADIHYPHGQVTHRHLPQ